MGELMVFSWVKISRFFQTRDVVSDALKTLHIDVAITLTQAKI